MATSRVDRHTFLTSLRQSGLISDEKLDRLELPDTRRGRLIARALVEQEILTRFQAERLLAGRTQGFVLDQYVILDLLGKGGMGRVYKARHRTMNRIVALKVLANHLLKTPRAKELFLREVEAIARLQHPHIVAAYDANKVGDRYYLVLEYVDGPNLDQLVRQQGPLSVGQACDFVRQIAAGLQCAHVAGMVHRDVKPANVLLQPHGAEGDDAPGLVKISDFGLARLQNADGGGKPSTILSSPKKVMGTPDYLSPEQSRNVHEVDIRSDLYSLGCTFYFLLAGRVPFPGGTAVEKIIRHSTKTPRSVERFRDDVPPQVSAILRRLMARDPERRFQTPAELIEALEPYSVSGPTPWQPIRPSPDVPLDDLSAPTEDSDVDGGPHLELIEFGSAAARGSTFPPDLSPTPIISDSSANDRQLQQRGASPTRQLLLWVFTLIAAVIGGLLLYHAFP